MADGKYLLKVNTIFLGDELSWIEVKLVTSGNGESIGGAFSALGK